MKHQYPQPEGYLHAVRMSIHYFVAILVKVNLVLVSESVSFCVIVSSVAVVLSDFISTV